MPSENSQLKFEGFEQPRQNYYRLPNSIFDTWLWYRETRNSSRIDGPIKWLEYLIKHSWGYLRFDQPIRLTKDEFQLGRRKSTSDGSRGGRMDRGTGLSSRALVTIPRRLLDSGLIERHQDDSDQARVKIFYLPRVRRPEVDPLTPSHSPDTFPGFDEPRSNYFPVPFVWTDLTRDINSGVAILSGEYLMRHTFGWRDRVRWLTPTEIASGRQRQDGSTYDEGIHYPRSTTASACDRMVDEGLFVWRPAQRDIGREKREYALRMRHMLVDEDSGRFLGWAEGAEEEHYKGTSEKQSKPPTSQSTPLTRQSKPLTGQSTAPEPQQSTSLTRQSTPPNQQSKPLAGQSIPPTGQSTPRTGSNTHRKHTTKHSDKTHTTTQRARARDADAADADAAQLRHALDSLGIGGRKRGEILSLDDPPTCAEAFGWAYWAHAQDWPDNPTGLAIQRLLNPETRHSPPAPFDRFGEEYATPSLTACALTEAYRLSGYQPLGPPEDGELPRLWREHFSGRHPDDLPPAAEAARIWARERQALNASPLSPAEPDIEGRWRSACDAALPSSGRDWRALTEPLGYADGALVFQVEGVEARVRLEDHREALEARLQTPIQLTAAALAPPTRGEQDELSEPSQAAELWEDVVHQLRLCMSQAVFDRHFRHCTPAVLEDHTLTLHSDDDGSLSWIKERLGHVIAGALRQVPHDVARLRLVTASGGEVVIETARDE